MSLHSEWQNAQEWERNWWMTYRNQHPCEVTKNSFVSKMMFLHEGVPSSSIIDIGCGPLSLLLRVPCKKGVALDPIHYGDLEDAYVTKGIQRLVKRGEDLTAEDGTFDEAWIYNCLQHVEDPTKIIENALTVSKVVRIFEWTYIKPYKGHLHELTPELLTAPFTKSNWHTLMTTKGFLNHSGLNGNYFMGIFSKNAQESL
jgi:SAM-dependent methyltransferase